MNYGENFLESYNNKFIERKKDFINYLEENYDSHKTYEVLFRDYIEKLHKQIKEIEEIINWRLINDCYNEFNARYYNNRKNPIVNVVQNKIFDKYKKYNKNPEIDFSDFCNYVSTVFLFRDFESLLERERNVIKIAFEKESTKGLLKLRKNNFREYLLIPEILPNSTRKIIKQSEIDSENNNNPFTDDEKLIIVNYFIQNISSETSRVSNFEQITILKLIAGVFLNKSLEKKRDTFYDKYSKGINYSTKTARVKQEQVSLIISKLKKFQVNKFIKYLEEKQYLL